jgi:hypothetical protein
MQFRYEVWDGEYLLRRFYDKGNAEYFMSSRPTTTLKKLKREGSFKKFCFDYFTEQYGEPPF